MRLFVAAAVSLSLATSILATPQITRESLTFAGQERTYYLFVPSETGPAAPLLILLHGSGRDGKVLLNHWKSLAEKEGIILAGPEAIESSRWQFPADGPVFLRDVVREVQKRAPVDPRRVYLFGHSAGANFAVPMALLQSTYFAAAAAHAGGIVQGNENAVDLAKRKVPIFLIVGIRDRSLAMARTSNELLTKEGFPTDLVELPRHGHDYYGRSREINQKVWQFLSSYALDSDPAYITYSNIPE